MPYIFPSMTLALRTAQFVSRRKRYATGNLLWSWLFLSNCRQRPRNKQSLSCAVNGRKFSTRNDSKRMNNEKTSSVLSSTSSWFSHSHFWPNLYVDGPSIKGAMHLICLKQSFSIDRDSNSAPSTMFTMFNSCVFKWDGERLGLQQRKQGRVCMGWLFKGTSCSDFLRRNSSFKSRAEHCPLNFAKRL